MQSKKYIAEAFGTFVLTFFGCGSAAIAGSTLGNLGIAFAFGLGDEPRPAAAWVEVFDKDFGIKPFSVLGPDGMGLELGDNLLGQQFHNSKILETARNARTAKETKPPCANEDKSRGQEPFSWHLCTGWLSCWAGRR